MDFPASNLSPGRSQRRQAARGLCQVSRPVGAAGRVAACHDRGGLSWRAGAGRRISPLSRPLQSSFHPIVLSRVGGFAADRAARSSRRTIASWPMSDPTIGLGSAPFQNLDSVPDAAKLGFAGLLAPRQNAPLGLRSAICGLFKVEAEVEEFVGSRLALETEEWTILGRRYNVLGDDALLGAASSALRTSSGSASSPRIWRNMSAFCRRAICASLWPIWCFSISATNSIGTSSSQFRTGAAEPVRLGSFGQLGWTTWMAPNWTSTEIYRCDARFHPADRYAA